MPNYWVLGPLGQGFGLQGSGIGGVGLGFVERIPGVQRLGVGGLKELSRSGLWLGVEHTAVGR